MPSASSASRSTLGSPVGEGARLSTKPPFAPTGTITAFFTACAFTRPSTSVRKSSRRSDQRRPPRATGPNRRCTPSNRGEYTKISNRGRGAGRYGTSRGSSFHREVRHRPAGRVTDEVVRAQGRVDQGQQAAQDAVRVEAGDLVDQLGDLDRQRLGARAPVVGRQHRAEPGLEQPDQRGRHVGVAEHGVLDVVLAVGLVGPGAGTWRRCGAPSPDASRGRRAGPVR